MKKSRNITPLKALEILNKNGQVYTVEQATEVLNLLYELAEIELEAFLNGNNNMVSDTEATLIQAI
jgi:hypothetical protein